MFGTASFLGLQLIQALSVPLGQTLFTRSYHEDVKSSKIAQKYSNKYSKIAQEVRQKCSKSTPKVL